MIREMVKYLPYLIPLGILIVAVTAWSRWIGDPLAVIVPPVFAIGSAAFIGRFLQRRSRKNEKGEDSL